MKREMRKQNAKCNAKTKRAKDYSLKQRELEDLSKQLEKQLVNSARDIATGSKRLPTWYRGKQLVNSAIAGFDWRSSTTVQGAGTQSSSDALGTDRSCSNKSFIWASTITAASRSCTLNTRESIFSEGAAARKTLEGIADVIAISAAAIALENKKETQNAKTKYNAKTKRAEDYLLKKRELEDLSKQLEIS